MKIRQFDITKTSTSIVGANIHAGLEIAGDISPTITVDSNPVKISDSQILAYDKVNSILEFENNGMTTVSWSFDINWDNYTFLTVAYNDTATSEE